MEAWRQVCVEQTLEGNNVKRGSACSVRITLAQQVRISRPTQPPEAQRRAAFPHEELTSQGRARVWRQRRAAIACACTGRAQSMSGNATVSVARTHCMQMHAKAHETSARPLIASCDRED